MYVLLEGLLFVIHEEGTTPYFVTRHTKVCQFPPSVIGCSNMYWTVLSSSSRLRVYATFLRKEYAFSSLSYFLKLNLLEL